MDILQTLSDEVDFMPILAATILIGLIGVYLKYKVVPLWGKSLPPVSYGLPFVGETLSFPAALKQSKYGPIFKTSILGSKMVIATGQSGNKFLFSGINSCVNFNQLPSEAAILERKGMFDRLFKL